MSIEQHAEAAANETAKNEGWHDDSDLTLLTSVIAKHMQAAIDEATAPLRARIAVLEGLGPMIEELEMAAVWYGEAPPKDKAERARKVGYVQTEIKRILKGGAT